MLSKDFFSIAAMVSVFKRGLGSFHIARKCINGMFFYSIKVKMQSAYQSAFRRILFFSFSNPGFSIIKFLHFATHMSFLLLSLFLFRKNVETNCSVVPITFSGMRLSQILSRVRHMGRVCGYKYKINYRLNRQPITGNHL